MLVLSLAVGLVVPLDPERVMALRRVVLALLDDEHARGTYSLVAGEQALDARELVALHASLTGREPVRFVAAVGSGTDASGTASGADGSTGGALPAGAETFAPYFDVRCRFTDERARGLPTRAGVEKPDPRDFLGRLIAYARAAGWGKRPISREASFAVEHA
jgi:hypothetical protein